MALAIPFELTVQELKEWRDQGKPHMLIDVREVREYNVAQMGGTLMPLATLPLRLNDLDPDAEIIVHCHHGGRSGMATEFLRRNGFEKARNLRGGIDAWSREIDPAVPRY
jgi:adenylyltransferase/sulfurtransferase